MALYNFLGAIPSTKRTKVINAFKICEGDPNADGTLRKKDGSKFTDEQWANFWMQRHLRNKLKEAEQKKKDGEIEAAQKAVDTDFPEE